MIAKTLIAIGEDLQRISQGQKSKYNSNVTEDFLEQVSKQIASFNRARVEVQTDEDRLSRIEAAKHLHMSPSTFRRKILSGELPCGRKVAGWKELSWSKKELDQLTIQNLCKF